MASVKKVLIVGGGIGGLSLAIGLVQKGIAVEVVERQADWKVYHVGIIVQGNFVRALASLGIAEESVKAGYAYKGLKFLDTEGNVIETLPGIPIAGPDYPTDLGITRPALHEVLTSKVKELGIPVRLGLTFTALQETDTGVHVTFTDGSANDYDLVVGADGNYSATRRAVFPEAPAPRYTGQGVWRYNVPRPKDLEWSELYLGKSDGKAGYCPLSEDTMYIFAVFAEPGNPRFPPDTLAAEFKKRLEGYGGLLGQLRDTVDYQNDLVVYRPLEAIIMPDPWYRGHVVLLGDAAHSATPHLGQGAAMAIEDAVVLAEELAKDQSLESAQRAYMDRRYKRAGYVGLSSIQLGEWEQHNSPDADPVGLTREVLRSLAEPI